MTPREIEDKHAFYLIKDECLILENDMEKLQQHLFAVGLASLATRMGDFIEKTKKVRNYAVRDEAYKYTKQNTPPFSEAA